MEPAEIKNKAEAVLFSTGKKVNVDYIAKLCRANKEDVLKALRELKADYEAKGASLLVADEGEFWKLTVREAYSP
ncbi:SMC-Scp complex subunit ScpB, partial [Candidatus Woesearchaeota archaeon]|nr:SMC-Scp complex subunit ScpB [Candidatus Woesearchaeota archaeon]